MTMNLKPVLAVLIMGGLVACAPSETTETADTTPEVVEVVEAPNYAAIVANPDRLPSDLDTDGNRKPVETLEFLGVMPGMTVYDMESGGGYFAELLARSVGPEGKVYLQNPASFAGFLGTAVEERLAEERVPNISVITAQFDALQVEDASVDIVTWVMGPHELYFAPPAAPDGLGDVEGTYTEVARILKPGGVFFMVDHVAETGAPASVGGTLHRIDPALVQAELEKAGFVLDAQSDLLANSEDPHTAGVFDPTVAGNTDRFMWKYRKPS